MPSNRTIDDENLHPSPLKDFSLEKRLQKESRLCSLPYELRAQIYKLVLQPCCPSWETQEKCGGIIHIIPDDTGDSRYPFSHTALLCTCQHIYNEAHALPSRYAFFVFGYSQKDGRWLFREHQPFSTGSLETHEQIWRFRPVCTTKFIEELKSSIFHCNYNFVKMPEQNRPGLIPKAWLCCSRLSDIAGILRLNIRPSTLRVTMYVFPENVKDTLNVTKQWEYPELRQLVVCFQGVDEAELNAITKAAPAQIRVSNAKSLSLMERYDAREHGKCIKVCNNPSKTVVWQWQE